MYIHEGVAQVLFDPASRRFEGAVHLSKNGKARILQVSTPGHPSWSHRRIRDALIASAKIRNGARHANF